MHILGDLTVWLDGQPVRLGGEKQRTVLGVLAAQPGVWVRREEIADVVWDGASPAGASLVQTYMSRLRRVLAPPQPSPPRTRLLTSKSGSYRLEIEPDQLDLLAFRKLAAEAESARAVGDLSRACASYDAALEMCSGTPLADLHGLEHYPPRTAIAEHHAKVILDYAEAAATLGCPEHALPHLRALVRRDPLNEKAAAHLMQALAAEGQQAAALQVYADLAARLDAELGVRPGPGLMEAQLRVLRRQNALPAARNRPLATPGRDASGGRHPVPRQLPATARPLIGRTAPLETLSRLAEGQHRTAAVAVISGTAGVGKTALAVHWARQAADLFPDGQLYIDLRGFDPSGSPLTPGEVVRGFLEALGVPASQVPPSADVQAGLYRSMLAARRVLIVADNAASAAQVRPLLPGGSGCLVLITSRWRLDGLVATDGAQPVYLSALTTAESTQLLSSFVGADRLAAEPSAVTELAGLCAGLPLALCVAGARAQGYPRFPLAALAAELRDASQRLDELDAGDAAASPRSAFSWSYRRLGKVVARTFRLIGLAAGPDIGAAAVASLTADPGRRPALALAELTRSNLLTEHAPGRYSLHDLLRAYAAEQCRARETAADRDAACGRLLDHYLHTAHAADRLLFPARAALTLAPAEPGVVPERFADQSAALAWFQAEHRVLLAALASAGDRGLDKLAWQLSCCVAMFLDTRGYWQEFATVQQLAVAAASRLGDLTALARAHHGLAHACARLQDNTAARAHFTAALRAYRDLADHEGQGSVFIGLGQLAQATGNHQVAIRHSREAARHFQRANHGAGQARAFNQSAFALANLGDVAGALADCRRAVGLYQDLHASGAGLAEAWDTLGFVHQLRGEFRPAVRCYERAVYLFWRLDSTYDRATVLIHLGESRALAGQRWAARSAWERALAILAELSHPDAAAIEAKLRRL